MTFAAVKHSDVDCLYLVEADIAASLDNCHRRKMSDSHGAAEWRRRGKGCGCLLLIFVLVPLLLLKVCQKLDQHPTDRVMVEEFNSNRSTFGSLLNMVRAEKRVSRVADDFIWIDGAMNVNDVEQPRYLPRERLSRYRALFRKLNLESGVVRRADGTIGFLRSSSGMVTSGSSKEFIWSKNVITSALKPADRRSLEDACVPKGRCSVIRRIAPEWYIAFDSD